MRWVISALAVALVATALIPPASAGTPQRKLCPRGVDRGDQFRIVRLEGKIMRRARRIARKHDCVVRVVRRDGRWLIVTADLRGDRVNVAVEGRRVVRAYETSQLVVPRAGVAPGVARPMSLAAHGCARRPEDRRSVALRCPTR